MKIDCLKKKKCEITTRATTREQKTTHTTPDSNRINKMCGCFARVRLLCSSRKKGLPRAHNLSTFFFKPPFGSILFDKRNIILSLYELHSFHLCAVCSLPVEVNGNTETNVSVSIALFFGSA